MAVNVKSPARRSASIPLVTSDVCCAPVDVRALDVEQAGALAAVFAALADPARLRIYSIIASAGEVCSCDLEGPTGLSQPTVSHHTARLVAAGLVEGERRGRWTWWRAVPDQVDAVTRILGR
ncbi:MAG TPA: metalloregulator ArsR/SmtB family transcription factor [Acidimicrobiales bacterium]|nr:metalloregulator ArsR/SmtB family transcription factor [Acidimicrobiales bacterium]